MTIPSYDTIVEGLREGQRLKEQYEHGQRLDQQQVQRIVQDQIGRARSLGGGPHADARRASLQQCFSGGWA